MATQSDIRFDFALANGPAFDVVRFTLVEALSAPFRLEVELSTAEASLDLGLLLGEVVRFTLCRGGDAIRCVDGIVTGIEQGESGFRRTRYRAIVEPAVHRLALRRNSRIFQRRSIPEILKIVLDEQGILAEFAAAHPHPLREYCVQHRESDFDFMQRVAAEEGFVFYFDPGERSELRLIDTTLACPELPGRGSRPGTVMYHAMPGGDVGEPGLWRFTHQRRMASTRATLRDYTFRLPNRDLQHGADARDGIGEFEHYDAPGRYKADATGRACARLRLAALRSGTDQASIQGDDARLWPGLAFELNGHPSSRLNRDWRVVALVHQGEQSSAQEEESASAEQGSSYRYEGTVVPADVDWQAPLRAAPVMDGPQIAHVVGPEGEQIYTDESGRVMVWFPWDREGPKQDSTCWIRVSQTWAGPGYGAMQIPRVGHEVMVSFLDGDPDQPIVTGRSYHAANPPPYALPALKTLVTLKSQEHHGRGHNELLLDDTHGELKAQLRSTHAGTALNLGYLTHPRATDGTGEPRGEGFELRTDANGALRAAHGLLLTAYGRSQATGSQLDHRELVECVQALSGLLKSLGDTAAAHHALPDVDGPRDALVAAITQMGGGANDRKRDEAGKPVVAINAPDGIVMATPRTMLLAASERVEIASERDQRMAAGGVLHRTAGKGVSEFAIDGGLSYIAHRDDIRIQAQHGNVDQQAEKNLQLQAGEQIIQSAQKKIVLGCGQSALVLHADGQLEVFGSALKIHADVEIDAAAPAESAFETLGQIDTSGRFALRQADGETPAAQQRYRMTLADGSVLEGISDALGMTELLEKDAMSVAQLEVLDDPSDH
ncbi:type VI secretion system tip protein TssI/VgrG [Stenotrophomonas maltophilia]|uniref:type VI secretion system Vgr family protein n=1 Tax=Stenotrophomonas maltophilia TaxID=40324 RepID=UPI0018D3CA1B|nr:type VI secretion system tip protein VgrG [Stenotrophomonas maltophilia]